MTNLKIIALKHKIYFDPAVFKKNKTLELSTVKFNLKKKI